MINETYYNGVTEQSFRDVHLLLCVYLLYLYSTFHKLTSMQLVQIKI